MGTEQTIVLYTDGAARGNPGPAGIGIVVKEPEGKVLKEVGKYIGENTNNEAEYRALIEALKLALDYDPKAVEVFSDSSLLVNQIKGDFKVKKPHLKILHQQAAGLLNFFDSFEIVHIAREKNKVADRLANQAIERHFNTNITNES